MFENESMMLEDGRTLSYSLYGSPIPITTIVYMHGFPSSRFEGRQWHTTCTRHNVRLISPDRPGSGLSTFQPNRRILDWPADVLALVDHLKINEFYILGVSGGSPPALACMKEIGKDRLLGVTIISGLYPLKFGTAGMLVSTRILMWVAPWLTGLTATLIDTLIGKASRNKDPKVLEKLMSKGTTDNAHLGDRKAIEAPAYWPVFVDMTRESFHQGSEGASWEARLYGSDWGFELEQLDVSENGIALTLWHGTTDMNVPVSMAKKANELIAGSLLHLKEGEGHVSFISRDADEILDDLLGFTETEEYLQEGE
ncbi:alpha/beta hydrolase fold domain-containing protein [Cucurbitaria berberidis CBS 394.84]|uniref:Alpha/beta hydrolase fold domain-containing protein n=1 Tax=Cucurbitaria berberidis CBS 394.84 TaxID=1168544 RepID=A0A9P4L4X1_9PLEO|nr:alpha/beta hydrolase fold domain-containing protein [Cucurbitaria berberidis CBS 394.84]KAF1841970.1 alpha/beta hydrolase fold domain-containing protein [Cucurbitaria berberidis CBS 394.84]